MLNGSETLKFIVTVPADDTVGVIEIVFKVGDSVSKKIVWVQAPDQLPAGSWYWMLTVLVPETKLMVVENLPWESVMSDE